MKDKMENKLNPDELEMVTGGTEPLGEETVAETESLEIPRGGKTTAKKGEKLQIPRGGKIHLQ